MSVYDWRALVTTAPEHEARANQHRPIERKVLRREALRLRAQGLRPRDIAEAFGLNPHDIELLIYGPDEPQEVT